MSAASLINLPSSKPAFILLIATLVINNFTKEKLGLNPDEYTQKDIYIRK